MYNSHRRSGSLQMDETAALGLLAHLDIQQLQSLLDNDNKLNDLIRDLDQVKNIDVEKETLYTSNKSLAEYNLSQKPKLQECKDKLYQVCAQAEGLQEELSKKKQELDEKSSETSLSTTLALLQVATQKAEEQSDGYAEDLMDSKLEADEFRDKFIEARKLYHLRKIKAEKMGELMREHEAQQARQPAILQGSSAGGSGWPAAPAPYPAPQQPWAAHAPPYPPGGGAMPSYYPPGP